MPSKFYYMKLSYERPLVEIIEVNVEDGFAQSFENSSGVNVNIGGWGSGDDFGGSAE